MKQVTITIAPDGTSKVDADGFKGKGCAEATEALEMALTGGDRSGTDDKRKPDYFATNTGTALNRN